MSDHDRDFGPAIDPTARRDPTLSILREPRSDSPAWSLRFPREATGWVSHVFFAVFAAAALAGILILAGLLLHVVWDAIMAGWTIL